MNLLYWALRPRMILPRVRYWAWERANPDKPWLCPATVDFCERALNPSMTAVEFGSGRSTAWFARQVGSLTSVEHHEGWHDRVRAGLDRQGIDNVDYRLVPLDHPESEPDRGSFDPLPAYVAVLDEFPDGSIDLVVVDGHYRTTCLGVVGPKIRPGGLLLVDDVNLWGSPDDVPVPEGWPMVDRSHNGVKGTCVWRRPADA